MATKKKETIAPPKKPSLRAAGSLLGKGNPAGGRVLGEESVAIKQGIVPVRPRR